MQKAAAFFGGAFLGGVLSAACGFDLFRDDREREPRETIAGLKEELRGTKALLDQSKELLRTTDSRAKALGEKLASREVAPAGRTAQAELAQVRPELAAYRGEIARLQTEIEANRRSRDAAADEARRWESLLKDQVLSFFSRERDEWDAALASKFLAAAGSKEAQQELILALIRRNKPILMSLPHGEGSEGGFGAASAELAPATAREGESTLPGESSQRRP